MKNFRASHSRAETGETWVPATVVAALEAAGTTAHRIASSPLAWLERFGEDLLLSYKDIPARDRLLEGLPGWSAAAGRGFRRIFGKHLPTRNEDRAAPVLLSGDAALPL